MCRCGIDDYISLDFYFLLKLGGDSDEFRGHFLFIIYYLFIRRDVKGVGKLYTVL